MPPKRAVKSPWHPLLLFICGRNFRGNRCFRGPVAAHIAGCCAVPSKIWWGRLSRNLLTCQKKHAINYQKILQVKTGYGNSWIYYLSTKKWIDLVEGMFVFVFLFITSTRITTPMECVWTCFFSESDSHRGNWKSENETCFSISSEDGGSRSTHPDSNSQTNTTKLQLFFTWQMLAILKPTLVRPPSWYTNLTLAMIIQVLEPSVFVAFYDLLNPCISLWDFGVNGSDALHFAKS